MRSDQKARRPNAIGITRQTGNGTGKSHSPESWQLQQTVDLLPKRFCRCNGFSDHSGLIKAASDGFFDKPPDQQAQNNTRCTKKQKCGTPTILLRNPPTQRQTDDHRQVGACHEQTDDCRALFGRIQIRHQRNGRRHAARLTNGHRHAGQKQLPKLAGKATGHGGHTPKRTADRHNHAAVVFVGQLANRDPQGRIKQAKGQSTEQAHLGIGCAKLRFDGFHQNGNDLPINDRKNIDQGQERKAQVCAPSYSGRCLNIHRRIFTHSQI